MIPLLIFIVGLLLFMGGIHMMSTSLEKMALKRMQKILNYFTDTKIKTILFGVIMTALLHSSSTLTILVITLVSSGHMKLKQAIWIVMGANVGTTFSSFLFFVDGDVFAYVLFLVGFVLCFFHKYSSKVLIGLSFLFIGLDIMSMSLLSLQNEGVILSVIQDVSHPLILVFIGIVLCGVIQSSSACMAILLSFSKKGILTFSQGAFLLYGFDIGTCLDTSLAGLAGNKEGRKVAIFHFLFNLIGTLFFVMISLMTPFLTTIENSLKYDISVLFTILHIWMNFMTLFLLFFIDKYILIMLNKYIH